VTEKEQLAIVAIMEDPSDSTVLPGMANPRDFSSFDFTGWPAKLFDGKTFKNCMFYRENEPHSPLFPPDVKDMTLVRVNADNRLLPNGAKLDGSCNKQLKCFPA